MADGKVVPGSIWFYQPNHGAAIFFTVAFAVTTVWHFWQCSRYKAWKITGLHAVTCLLFVAGFACRAYGSWNINAEVKQNVDIYIASTCLIYLSPPLLELANYHTLGRILYYVPYESPMNPGRTLTTFGIVSTIIEILNGLGVAWIANPALKDNFKEAGVGLLQGGLILQMVVIVIFCGTAGRFHQRCAKRGVLTRHTRGPLYTMYVSSFLILIRCIYRTIEHFKVPPTAAKSSAGGASLDKLNHESPIIRYEWYFYVFEGMVLLLNEFLWNVRHPRYYLPQDFHIYLAQDGVTELEGPGWNDKRPLVLTILDPFGWLDTCAPSNKKAKDEIPFWEKNGFGKYPPSAETSRSPDRSRVASPRGSADPYSSNNVGMTASGPHAARNQHRAPVDPHARSDNRNLFIIFLDPLGWIWKKK